MQGPTGAANRRCTAYALPCLQSPKRRIGPSYFSDRAPVISAEQSALIVAALRQIGLIDRDGQLTANPKEDDVSVQQRHGCPQHTDCTARCPLATSAMCASCWCVGLAPPSRTSRLHPGLPMRAVQTRSTAAPPTHTTEARVGRLQVGHQAAAGAAMAGQRPSDARVPQEPHPPGALCRLCQPRARVRQAPRQASGVGRGPPARLRSRQQTAQQFHGSLCLPLVLLPWHISCSPTHPPCRLPDCLPGLVGDHRARRPRQAGAAAGGVRGEPHSPHCRPHLPRPRGGDRK